MQRRAEINVRKVCYQQTQFSHGKTKRTFFWIPKIHAEAEAQKRNSLAKNPISFFFFSRTQQCDGRFRTQKLLQPHQSYSSIPHYCLDLQNKSSKQYPPKSFLIFFFFSTTQQLWHDSDSTHRNSNSTILPELILWYPHCLDLQQQSSKQSCKRFLFSITQQLWWFQNPKPN